MFNPTICLNFIFVYNINQGSFFTHTYISTQDVCVIHIGDIYYIASCSSTFVEKTFLFLSWCSGALIKSYLPI